MNFTFINFFFQMKKVHLDIFINKNDSQKCEIWRKKYTTIQKLFKL